MVVSAVAEEAYTDINLSPNTEYTYEVDHYRSGQPSGKSNLIVESTDALPPSLNPPTNFVSTCDVVEGVEFEWGTGLYAGSAHTIIERASNVGFTTDVLEILDLGPGVEAALDHSTAEGQYWFRAFHRKSGWSDSVPTAIDDAQYFCNP